MTQRTEIYSSMDASFLRELAENINLSFRSHAETDKESLVRLLDKKISPEKADTVFKMYLSCFNAEQVAKAIKPKGMEEIVFAVQKLFKTSTCLYEVTVGARRCDIVLFNDSEIIAVEVKSAQDQLKSATSQLSYYATWANRVFLAYDSRHKRTVDKLGIVEKGFGLLEFDRGTVKIMKNASMQESKPEQNLSLMTYSYLRKIAKRFNVQNNGKKIDIARHLAQKIPASEANEIFKVFLKTRSLR